MPTDNERTKPNLEGLSLAERGFLNGLFHFIAALHPTLISQLDINRVLEEIAAERRAERQAKLAGDIAGDSTLDSRRDR